MKKILFACALVAAAFGAQAQAWPARPVTLLVPFLARRPGRRT